MPSPHESATLLIQLYQLRRDPELRAARDWFVTRFHPTSAKEVFAEWMGTDSAKYRMMTTYWEMAASLVLHGSLSADLFVDCNPEPFYILAKFAPLLPAIHEKSPTWFAKTLQLIENTPTAAARFEAMKQNVEGQRAAMASR